MFSLKALVLVSMHFMQEDPLKQAQGLIEKLSADRVEDRDAASAQLAKLGHSILPHLETFLHDRDGELRSQIERTIERIYATDPLFLVRAPERRISATLKEMPIVEAHETIFKAFPIHPVLSREMLKDHAWMSKRITLSLEKSSYWDAVLAFERASGACLDLVWNEYQVEGTKETSVLKPREGFLWTAKAKRMEAEVLLRLSLHMEPGWHPISTALQLDSLETVDGKSLLEDFQVSEENGSGEFSRKGKGAQIPEGAKLRVRGKVRVTVPTRIEWVEFRPDRFKAPESQALSTCTITVEKLEVKERDLAFKVGTKGPLDAPPDKDYRAELWILIADDRGRSHEPFRFSGDLQSSIRQGIGSYPTVPTRLCFIRPLEAESFEVPLYMEGIPVRDEK